MPGTFATTTRNALRALLGTSKISDIDEGFLRLAEDVDTKMASFWQDTLDKRPAAAQPNRIFRATDTGLIYLDNGTLWQQLTRTSELEAMQKGTPNRVFAWAHVNVSGAIARGEGGLTTNAHPSDGIYVLNVPSHPGGASYAAIVSALTNSKVVIARIYEQTNTTVTVAITSPTGAQEASEFNIVLLDTWV